MPEGGEIRHDNVRLRGTQLEWLQVYQFTTSDGMSADLPPLGGQGGALGACVDERTSPTWPFAPFGFNVSFEHFPMTPVLTGTGIDGFLPITENTPPNTVGNSTLRNYGFTYGGGAPGASGTFNASLTAANATGGGVYTLDIGEQFAPGRYNEGSNITYTLAAPYVAPLGIGGSATVMIPASHDLTVTWTAPSDVLNPSTVVPNTYVNYMLFVDLQAGRPQFICFTDSANPGTLTIPAAVLAQLPANGLVFDADETHYQAAAVNPLDPSREIMKRFDVVTSWMNVSQYQLQ